MTIRGSTVVRDDLSDEGVGFRHAEFILGSSYLESR